MQKKKKNVYIYMAKQCSAQLSSAQRDGAMPALPTSEPSGVTNREVSALFSCGNTCQCLSAAHAHNDTWTGTQPGTVCLLKVPLTHLCEDSQPIIAIARGLAVSDRPVHAYRWVSQACKAERVFALYTQHRIVVQGGNLSLESPLLERETSPHLR